MRDKSGGLFKTAIFFLILSLMMGYKSARLSADYFQEEFLEDKMDALITMDLKGVSLI